MKTDLITMGLLLAGGALSGLLFDFYRMLRRQGRWNRAGSALRWLTFCSDLVFSAAVLGILLFFFRKANFLEFRLYLFITSLMGLVLYLVLLSSRVKGFLARFFSLTRYVGGTVTGWGKIFFKGIGALCHLLLAIPYEILRWFGLLIYRFGEAVLRGLSWHTFEGHGKRRERSGKKRGEKTQRLAHGQERAQKQKRRKSKRREQR